jgi:hypothetical protein
MIETYRMLLGYMIAKTIPGPNQKIDEMTLAHKNHLTVFCSRSMSTLRCCVDAEHENEEEQA